jgi:hypothetical protein
VSTIILRDDVEGDVFGAWSSSDDGLAPRDDVDYQRLCLGFETMCTP